MEIPKTNRPFYKDLIGKVPKSMSAVHGITVLKWHKKKRNMGNNRSSTPVTQRKEKKKRKKWGRMGRTIDARVTQEATKMCTIYAW